MTRDELKALPYAIDRCCWCAYWVRADAQFGHCRYNAPVPMATMERARWPLTDEHESCGQFAQALERK